MKVHAIADEALGNTSYVIEAGDGLAISVDPRRDADDHLRVAAERGVRIAAALETHLHADFVGGMRELAQASGAEIYAAADARIQFPHRPVSAHGVLRVGGIVVEVLPTPGHTPEHVAYVVSDGADMALFSGGSLIVGGAARTDLTGDERTDELSRAQFASLRGLAALPEKTLLYPTHGAGSFCSTGPARSTASTIGDERASNELFRLTDEDAFVARLRAGFGSYPRYFAHLSAVNRAGAPLLSALSAPAQIDAGRARDAVAGGAWLIDARPADQWARAHAEGSVSIEMRPAFASWLGWVVPFGEPFVVVAEPDDVAEAVRLARRIGYDRFEGWLRFESWRDAGLAVSSVPLLEPQQAAERVRDGAQLMDVRQRIEFDEGRIPDAVNIEAGAVIAGAMPDAPEVITYCDHGLRSATAASLLARRGVRVANLAGGASAWRKAGLAYERAGR